MKLKNIQGRVIGLLRWSERYTKTDMTYLAKGSFWLWFGQILTFVFSFALTWVFANFLAKETYGTYKFVLSIYALVSISTLSGIGVSIARSVAKGHSGAVKKAIKEKIRWGFVGSLITLGFALYYYTNENVELALLFVLTSVFIPFAETFGDYQFYLQGKKDFQRTAIYRTIQRALISISVIAVILIFTKNIYIIVLTYLLTFTAGNFILYKKTLEKHPPNNKEDPETVPYGFHLSVMGALRIGAAHVDKILLFHFVGPALLAIYYFAIAIPQEMTSFFSQINNLAFPKFAEKHGEETKRSLLGKIAKFTVFLLLPVAVYILIAPYLFEFFFPEYLDSVLYSQIFALNILFIPFALITQFFSARGDTRVLYFTNLAEPIILISLFVILLPLFGVAGAVAALIVKNILNAAVLLFFFVRDKKPYSFAQDKQL